MPTPQSTLRKRSKQWRRTLNACHCLLKPISMSGAVRARTFQHSCGAVWHILRVTGCCLWRCAHTLKAGSWAPTQSQRQASSVLSENYCTFYDMLQAYKTAEKLWVTLACGTLDAPHICLCCSADILCKSQLSCIGEKVPCAVFGFLSTCYLLNMVISQP